MNIIKRWIQIWAYKIWGIPWRPADYRHELLNCLQNLAHMHGLSITTIGSMGIHVRLGILEVEIPRSLPPIVIKTWISLTDLAAIGQEYSKEAYMRFKSETRFKNLVDPKTVAGLILQQAGQADLILKTGSARNAA